MSAFIANPEEVLSYQAGIRDAAEKLANLACEIDGLRAQVPPFMWWHDDVTQAVALLHCVAMDIDNSLGMKLYSCDDEDDEWEAA